MAIRLSPLEIVRCRFPERGDPTRAAQGFHRVLVARVIQEANGTQWALVVFGTGQGTIEKNGPPCGPAEIDVDAGNGTGLDEQTRFHFAKHVALPVQEPFFPDDPNTLKRGRVPLAQKQPVIDIIDSVLPSPAMASKKMAAPTQPEIKVRKKLTLGSKPQPAQGGNGLPMEPGADAA